MLISMLAWAAAACPPDLQPVGDRWCAGLVRERWKLPEMPDRSVALPDGGAVFVGRRTWVLDGEGRVRETRGPFEPSAEPHDWRVQFDPGVRPRFLATISDGRVLAVAPSGQVAVLDSTVPRWAVAPALPGSPAELGVGVADGVAWAAGGTGSWRLGESGWEQMADLPEARTQPNVVSGPRVCAGGVEGCVRWTGSAWVESDVVTAEPPLYAIDGRTAELMVLGPHARLLTADGVLRRVPVPYTSCAGAVDTLDAGDGHVVCIAERTGDLVRYDPHTGSVSRLPVPRSWRYPTLAPLTDGRVLVVQTHGLGARIAVAGEDTLAVPPGTPVQGPGPIGGIHHGTPFVVSEGCLLAWQQGVGLVLDTCTERLWVRSAALVSDVDGASWLVGGSSASQRVTHVGRVDESYDAREPLPVPLGPASAAWSSDGSLLVTGEPKNGAWPMLRLADGEWASLPHPEDGGPGQVIALTDGTVVWVGRTLARWTGKRWRPLDGVPPDDPQLLAPSTGGLVLAGSDGSVLYVDRRRTRALAPLPHASPNAELLELSPATWLYATPAGRVALYDRSDDRWHPAPSIDAKQLLFRISGEEALVVGPTVDVYRVERRP